MTTEVVVAPPTGGASDGGHGALVSVLLPVFNGGEFLLPALESIVRQTYRDLEILVIDDGSVDGAVDAAVAAVGDQRVRVLRHANIGLAPSLNRGIREAAGEYLARMDADDIAVPDRIERQVAVLAAERDVVMVGGQIIRLVGEGERETGTRFPLDHDRIVRGLLATEHVLCHPAVTMRTDAARRIGGYWAYGPAEDWDLFLRISEVGRIVNIPSTVLEYRFHASGINASSMARVRANMRLATINHRRRLAGRAELAPADLAHPRWAFTRVAVAAQVRSLSSYRRSLSARAAGRPVRAAAALAESAAFWPQQAVRRIVSAARAPQTTAMPLGKPVN